MFVFDLHYATNYDCLFDFWLSSHFYLSFDLYYYQSYLYRLVFLSSSLYQYHLLDQAQSPTSRDKEECAHTQTQHQHHIQTDYYYKQQPQTKKKKPKTRGVTVLV